MNKYTIKNFDKELPNDVACLEWIKNHRYPNGIECPICQKVTKHHKVTSRPVYECDNCGHQISPLANTIFHKSSTSLRTWFHAIFLMSSTRCGISAKQLQRETGVTYKTAWRMFKQIRSLLNDNSSMILSGKVEADETYVGGKAINMHKSKRVKLGGRGTAGKTPVFGMVERQGNVVAMTVPNTDNTVLVPQIKKHVSQESTVITDDMGAYETLKANGYKHEQINHSAKMYVSGDIHTNTIDGFWSLVKRGISGVYHNVSPKYLDSYFNEYEFRYNHRKDETPMFQSFLNRIESHS
jgi:transposase-like protein/ribosomal protein L37AE/L43A